MFEPEWDEYDGVVVDGVRCMNTFTANLAKLCRARGAEEEQARIIKLLEAEYDNKDENGNCVYINHYPQCCNCDVIALIKGEK